MRMTLARELKMISPGRVCRYGWCVPTATNLSNQFGRWEHFYGRPSWKLSIDRAKMFANVKSVCVLLTFLFTEPSVEVVDVSCFKCGGKWCNVCKKTVGLIVVHPWSLRCTDPTSIQDFDLVKSVWLCSVTESRYLVASIKEMFLLRA